MPENSTIEETELVEAAAQWLRERLPPTWEVTRRADETNRSPDLDATIDLRGPSGTFAIVPVEPRRSLDPRGAEELLPRLTRVLRTIAGNVPVLVVAPWLSARTQEVLERENLNFLDLTGNAFISLENPTLYLRSVGAARNPKREPAPTPRVRGPKAARLIRFLIDVRPPYGVSDVARTTQLAPGYVSRLLRALDREALIERSGRGVVEAADFPGLLRRWAESYDVLDTNDAETYVAPGGVGTVLERVTAGEVMGRLAVTGSFGAVRFAPVSVSALLLMYCEDVREAASALGLLPADEGANVALLRPFDQVVWKGMLTDRDLPLVPVSQLAVDCLTGPGRMPSEGKALLDWMEANENKWRLDSVDQWH